MSVASRGNRTPVSGQKRGIFAQKYRYQDQLKRLVVRALRSMSETFFIDNLCLGRWTGEAHREESQPNTLDT